LRDRRAEGAMHVDGREQTEAQTHAAIARNLREFGYRDTTTAMVREIHKAMLDKVAIPYDIVGMFASQQVQEAQEQRLLRESNQEE
jgi:hypothetical protein